MTVTLNTLLDQALAFEANQTDILTTSDKMTFHPKGAVVVDPVTGSSMLFKVEEHAVQQVSEKLGIPYTYLQRCPAALQAGNMDYWATTMKKGWLVRTDEDVIRAVLDKDYNPIPTSFILQSLVDFTAEIPHVISHSYMERDDFHLRLNFTDAEVKGDHYAVGVYFGNGGVGNRAFRILPFIQRHSCTNSTQWKDGGYVMSHIRASLAFLKGTIKEKLGQVFQTSTELLNKLVEAEMREIPDPASEIARICKAHGLSQAIYAEILTGTENMRNGLGVMHGLSWAAHFAKGQSQRISLEELAGAYLVDPTSVFAKQPAEAEL